jgi:hypothetical protein
MVLQSDAYDVIRMSFHCSCVIARPTFREGNADVTSFTVKEEKKGNFRCRRFYEKNTNTKNNLVQCMIQNVEH